jgi:hypothetical protein
MVMSYDAELAAFRSRLDAALASIGHEFDVESRPPQGEFSATQLWITWRDGPPVCVFWLPSEALMVLVSEYTFDGIREALVPAFVAAIALERTSVRIGGWRRRAYLTVEVDGERFTTDRVFRDDLEPWEARL